MKKQIIDLVAFAILLTASFAAPAQSDHLIAANIPFNFYIKDRALPAGDYLFTLTRIGGADGVKIQSADGHLTAFVLTRPAAIKAAKDEPRLIFNRYDNQYFLAQVYGVEAGTLEQLARPRAEETLAKTPLRPPAAR